MCNDSKHECGLASLNIQDKNYLHIIASSLPMFTRSNEPAFKITTSCCCCCCCWCCCCCCNDDGEELHFLLLETTTWTAEPASPGIISFYSKQKKKFLDIFLDWFKVFESTKIHFMSSYFANLLMTSKYKQIMQVNNTVTVGMTFTQKKLIKNVGKIVICPKN